MDKILASKIKKMGYSVHQVKKEAPNYYEVEDGTILKVHAVINSLKMDRGEHPEGASVNGQNLVTAFVPKKLRGEPSHKFHSPSESNSQVEKEDMDFKVVAEHFNEYLVDEKWLLQIKTILTQVNRSKLRNNAGEPIYIISTSPAIKLKKKR